MKSVALHNLGCKVNAYELEAIGQKLQEKGYRIVPFDSEADIYIVNTCTVTNIADRKSRQMLHRAKKRNPEAVVVAVGCYVQTGKEKALLDESIDLAVGNNRKKELPEILEEFLKKREEGRKGGQAAGSEQGAGSREGAGRRDGQADGRQAGGGRCGRKNAGSQKRGRYGPGAGLREMLPEPEEAVPEKRLPEDHTRAYLKIQDGCNQFCSYCIIPYARGRVRSRKPENVLREVRLLAAAGCREVVLTGIHISSYGMDFIRKTDGDYLAGGKRSEADGAGEAVSAESGKGDRGRGRDRTDPAGFPGAQDHHPGIRGRACGASPRYVRIFIFPCRAAATRR